MSGATGYRRWIAIEQARCLWRGAKTRELERWYRALYRRLQSGER